MFQSNVGIGLKLRNKQRRLGQSVNVGATTWERVALDSPEARNLSEDGHHVDVGGSDPGDPVEVWIGRRGRSISVRPLVRMVWRTAGGLTRESLEETTGEPEVDKHGRESDEEELCPRHRPSVRDPVRLVVERLVERDGGQVEQPDAVLRVDDEPTAHSSESHADELNRETGEDLVAERLGPGLVVEDGQLLDDQDVHRVGREHSDVGHDGEEHVLLLVERSRVERRVVPEQPEPPRRECPREEDSDRVREQLDLVDREGERRLSDREELVDERSERTPERAEEPDAEGRDGEVVVVHAGDEGTSARDRSGVGTEGEV